MCAPIPMIQEPVFSVPVCVAPTTPVVETTPPVVDTSPPVVDAIPVVDFSSAVPNVNEDSIMEEPAEQGAVENEEQEQSQLANDVPNVEPLRRSQRVRRSAISDDYEVYMSEDIQIEGDPISFEEAMSSPHSSEWLAAIEDDMRSMSTNKV